MVAAIPQGRMKANTAVDTVSVVDRVLDWAHLTEKTPGEAMPTLNDAIEAVKATQAALSAADEADQAADAKLKEATDAKAETAKARAAASDASNSALDVLVEVATATKRTA